ncbi:MULTISPECIES: GNAT family N-acetyltransferase [unclassified Legionella]|uniref:GNAT family N-acetyltransferase n=1 Tax=unclassified Legionella TaxID=2622702 RepID=UPI001054D34A|nr:MULTISPECIES: GNAT family N-acetyltransferase [unclassified Legionella]MDI9819238.1 GNAT family N-acetyltransferase [Legionella sp. PL877]
MTSFDDIMTGEMDLNQILSGPLRKSLQNADFKLQLINEEEEETRDADLLIEAVFPENEAEEYKPGNILSCQKQVICLACLKNGIVLGCITASFDLEENTVSLHSLAIDKEVRNKKLGSVLMLAMHDICFPLGIKSMSLISSEYGKSFYKSFGFTEMAHQSYETSLPFKEEIIRQKISAFDSINQQNSTAHANETELGKNKRRREPKPSMVFFNNHESDSVEDLSTRKQKCSRTL